MSHIGYTFVKSRRDGSTIWKSDDELTFLKEGPISSIQHEKQIYVLLESYIDVPKVISYKETNQTAVMIEQSLGNKIRRDIFRESVDTNLRIDDDVINPFFDQIQTFLEKTHSMQSSKMIGFGKQMSPFEIVAGESWAVKYRKELCTLETKINQVLSMLPVVWCHGDFNAHNLAPLGCFDFEDSHMGYYGYDLFSAITHIFWFPISAESELSRSYTYTKSQILRCLKQCSKFENFMDPDIFGALFLLRGLWSCAKMHNYPILAKYRINKFRDLTEKYLSGMNIIIEVVDTFNQKWTP